MKEELYIPGKEFDRFKEILERSFLRAKTIGMQNDKFNEDLGKLDLRNTEILHNLIYYFDNIFRTAKLKTTENLLHTNRDFALELFAKVFSDLVHGTIGFYLTKTNFMMFLVGIIDNPNNSSPVAETIRLYAKEDDTVLITGETGTGKELHAKAIHYLSAKSKDNFRAINCAGIPDPLFESELFGYRKGAFTGATGDKIGILEEVGGGTLFLDEIGDMSFYMQAKMLRVLESGDYKMLGSTEVKHFKGRVIAATNKNLEEAIKTSPPTFRPDLFYRLNVLPTRLKSFIKLSDSERREAILNKLRHIIYKKSSRPGDEIIVDHLSDGGPTPDVEYDYQRDEVINVIKPYNEFITDEALQYLLNYDFPGNYRELDNIITRAYILSKKKRIEASSLPTEVTDFEKSELPECSIDTTNIDKIFLKKIVDHAETIKKGIVRRKVESVYQSGRTMKSKLEAEGIRDDTGYRRIRKRIVGIIGKEEMSRIVKGS